MRKIIIPYRSKRFTAGSTDLKFHFHLDVPEEEVGNLTEIVRILEDLGFDCAIDRVLVSIAGPQRKEIPWMYDLHNVPGDTKGGETLGAFSSTLVKDKADLIFAINSVAPKLSKIKGGIIEAELPVILMNQNGMKLFLGESDYIEPVRTNEIGFPVERSMRFETHHWFSMPKNGLPPIDLQAMDIFLVENDVRSTGGLFIVDGETSWGYASNSFSDEDYDWQRVEREQHVYRLFLQQHNLPTDTLESLVEQIVFIGKTENV